MTDLAIALSDVVERLADDRAVVGIAVARGASAEPEAVWRPRALEQEPGFLAYSITKTFTSTLMVLLQEEGRLSLDDSLARWHPEVPHSERISIRQLLNHTAGIPDYGGLASYHEAVRSSPAEPWSFSRFAAETFEKGLVFQPGAGWAYSNPGYMLLKSIAAEVTGETFAALISERIAEPLGLRRTFVAESVTDLSSLAAAPSALLSPDARLTDARDVYHPGWVSHGVLASTPSEIARFLGAVSCGGLLSPHSLREMTTLVRVPGESVSSRDGAPRWREPSYGLGLMADPASPWGALWGHSGGGPGYSASAFHAPDLRGQAVTVCAMCAIEEGSVAEEMVRAVMDCV